MRWRNVLPCGALLAALAAGFVAPATAQVCTPTRPPKYKGITDGGSDGEGGYYVVYVWPDNNGYVFTEAGPSTGMGMARGGFAMSAGIGPRFPSTFCSHGAVSG